MDVPVLKLHQPGEPLTIHCYVSEKRLDASLLQEQLYAYADSGLSETEQRYVQTENELLAVVFGMEGFHQYNYVHPVILQSDHKHLDRSMAKSLLSSPKRLQHMLTS